VCKIYKILYAAIPLKKWKSAIIQRHFERCPSCAGEIDLENDVVRTFFKPDWIQEPSVVWPQVHAQILSQENEPEKIRSRIFPLRLRLPRWALAAAASVFFILGTIGYFLWTTHGHKIVGPESSLPKKPTVAMPRVRVISVELEGKRAKAYIYQTPTATFIWIAPSKNIGG
jgi:predicted anti-sigma-YlaC factor YlaD